MFPVLFLLLSPHQAPSIASLNQMLANKDVAGLTKLIQGDYGSTSPFAILKGGAYDSGRFGWKAFDFKTVDGKTCVVFDTQLTSEDTGDLVFERVGDQLRYIPEDNDLGVLVTNHVIDWKFDIPTKTAVLTDEATFKHHGPANKAFMVRFSPQYKVTSVGSDAGPVPFTQTAGVVSLPTPAGVEPFKYTFAYKAVADLYAFAGSISAKEANLTNDYWYPMTARQPATYSITIHCPATWIAVAQGELVSTNVGSTERVTKYRMDLPVTYFSASCSAYKTHSEQINGRRYSVWSLHMTDQQMKDQCALYAPIIEFYDKNVAKYPFSGYGAVVSDAYGGGALEAYSFATYGFTPGEDGHETAHTWFGGMADNSYLHSFWNESFADYCDELYHRESPIGNHTARRLAFTSHPGYSAEWEAATLEDSGVAYGSVAGALGYGKGAYVLSMLEQELGTDTMFKAMQTWLQDQPKDRSAEWQDFEAATEKASGQNLSWFWDEWMRRPGVADFQVSDVAYSNGQVTANVKFASKPYRMKCEVLLVTSEGKKYQEVQINGDGQISIQSSEKPTLVSFDPWRKLLRRIKPDESPSSISDFRAAGVYRDPSASTVRPDLKGTLSQIPSDLTNIVIAGNPSTNPTLRSLCSRAGFAVEGNNLTYRGTTIDLAHGTATAVLKLPSGGSCMIAVGSSRWRPNPGSANICLADELGRFLDGETLPKTSGSLTLQLN